MEQVFQLQSIFALCVVLLEVPSGYLADLFGRRRSLVLAGVFHGAAFTVLAASHSFSGFVVFQVLAALANSFFSGSDVALLYDSEEALGESRDSTRSLGRKLLWAQVGETIAAPLGGALAIAGLQWPAVVNAVVAWLPLAVACTLIEPPRSHAERHHLENFRHLLRVLFLTTPILRRTLLALIAYGLATLLAVWAFQGFWTELEVPLILFGVIWAAYNLTVAVVGRAAHRLKLYFGPRTIVAAVGLLPVLGYGGMAFFAGWPASPWFAIVGGIAAGFSFQVGRGLNQVVIKGALNARVPKELRATANSISSLGVRVLFVFLGPLMGWSFDHYGYQVTFGGFTGLYVVIFIAIAVPLVACIGNSEQRG